MANELTDDENTPLEVENNDSGAPAESETETVRPSTKAPKSERGNSGSAKTKTRPSVYTVMLALSLVFVTIGCVVLWLELQQWGVYPWWKTTESIPQGGG